MAFVVENRLSESITSSFAIPVANIEDAGMVASLILEMAHANPSQDLQCKIPLTSVPCILKIFVYPLSFKIENCETNRYHSSRNTDTCYNHE